MNNKSYSKDESLNQSKSVIKQGDDDPYDPKEQILPSEYQEMDNLDETQNITFNFSNFHKIHIPISDFPILISLQKFYQEEFKQLIQNFELNCQFNKQGLNIETKAEENYHKDLKNEIQKYIEKIYTQKLALDYDSSRVFFRSNYILNQCAKLKYFIVKYKNSDQKIEIHLVSKQEDINIVANNLQQTLKGLRIFFLDVTNHMTTPKVNIDYKNLLAQLRQQYFKKIISDDLEESFANLEFQDVIDVQKPYSSVILGFIFPYDLEGKQQLCQDIYSFLKKKISSLFAIFIQFNPTEENLSQARLIENLVINFKQKNRFQCVCQVDQALKVIAILGTPEEIKIVFNEVLKEKKDKFSQELISSFSLCVLKKNFEFNPTQQIGSFEQQVSDYLKQKQNIQISNNDQLYIIKFLVKTKFESHCNLINFLCDKKISQDRDKVLTQELENIIKRVNALKLEGKLVERLQQKPERVTYVQRQYQYISEQQQNQNNQALHQNQEPSQNQRRQQQPRQIQNPIQNQILPQNQVQPNQQQEQQQQLPSTKQTTSESQSDSGLEGRQQILSLFASINSNSEQQLPKKEIIFNEPIVFNINDGTGKIKVSQNYQNYFKQLISQNNNQVNEGFISIEEDVFLNLKSFKKELKIYKELQQVISQQDQIIVKVQINGNADLNKSINENDDEKQDEQQNQQKNFYTVTDNNQICPVEKILK
ncbi:unnamed protein product [Paramecium sonneborni]|uniref:Uncharacterized protein n=1 Tax=Paramecium sonneborni TaxID=65129 RepID=A0A8S1KGX6_9CILI|nr:unnamed protein product [Paramecium sonneborni]